MSRLLGWPHCQLDGWPAALPAGGPAPQIEEWYVHEDICNKTVRSLVEKALIGGWKAQTSSELEIAEVAIMMMAVAIGGWHTRPLEQMLSCFQE